MWQPLVNAGQLLQGGRIRKVIYEGDFQHESRYTVIRIGDHYFMVEFTQQNGVELTGDRRLTIPYSVRGIPFHGFEYWQD